jgi:hypothetical protein
LTPQGICSYFVLMRIEVKTVGEAARRGMALRVECACGKTEYFLACDIVKVWNENRRLDGRGFRCQRCKLPAVKITALDIDFDRIPRGRVMRLKREGAAGAVDWVPERFRG